MKNVWFLIGHNSAHDIGEHATWGDARCSDAYHNMGGESYGQRLVNRPQAHEIMRQLKRALSCYDNSDCKQ